MIYLSFGWFMGVDGFWFKCMVEVIELLINSCILNGWLD